MSEKNIEFDSFMPNSLTEPMANFSLVLNSGELNYFIREGLNANKKKFLQDLIILFY
jgi:hypothetical protein